MLDPESPAVGVTDGTPAPASVIAETTPTDGQAADPSPNVAVEEPEGETTGDTDELTDAPEQSSPEQRSRWGKLRDREAAAQAKATELEERHTPFVALEPIKEHVLGITAGLTSDFSDPVGFETNSEAVLGHMFEIDPKGTEAVTGYVLQKYGHLRDEGVYGATPDQIRQALTLLRGGGSAAPASPLAPQAPAGLTLPPALADEWELMTPEAQAALSELLTSQSASEQARAQTSEQETAAQVERTKAEQEERKAGYRQTLAPFIQEKVVAWGVTEPDAQADFWNAVAGSISNSPSDLKAIVTAENHAAAGRLYAATSNNAAVKAVYEKHIGLVGSRLLKKQQAEAAAAGDAATARANGKNAPDHIPGSAAPPSVSSGWDRKTMTLEQKLAWIRENGPPPN